MSSVVLLGSTGSIGTQAVDIINANDGRFSVVGLAAGGANPELLIAQARSLKVERVAVADAAVAEQIADALPGVDVQGGLDAVVSVAGMGADTVLNGMTGSVGLRPTLAAVEAGSTVALANKESLVAGGVLVKDALRRADQLVPVDSEHSAIAQCLRSGTRSEVQRLLLTTSGGPFRGWTAEQLSEVTLEQALNHPNWSMGPVVTINSSTLVNKALELVEAHVLFDVAPELIDVVVHPQQIIHSMVEFIDGSVIAQASPPDMHLPIALGLSWPDRLAGATTPVDWTKPAQWDFSVVDDEVFPAIQLVREAISLSPLHPAVYNAANEECVQAFMSGNLAYRGIVDTVAAVVREYRAEQTVSLDAIDRAEAWARQRANELIEERAN